MTSIKPSRSDIWLVDLNPTRGHEQAGKRPCLVVSVDLFNQGASGLAVVLPITSKDKGIPFHVEANPPEGGLTQKSFIKCEDVRSISVERFSQKVGRSFCDNDEYDRGKITHSFGIIGKQIISR